MCDWCNSFWCSGSGTGRGIERASVGIYRDCEVGDGAGDFEGGDFSL